MKHLMFFSVLLVAFGLIVGCSEKESSPTEVTLDNTGFDANFSKDSGSKLKANDFSGDRGKNVGEFEIMLENLSPATASGASQPFSPPILATHKQPFAIFKEGSYASVELRQVAEDALNDPMISMLKKSSRVFDVAVGNDVVLPGEAAVFTIKARAEFRRLSLVAMLVNTNDGFVGADGIFLPANGTKEYYLYAYDAGTEKNTESKDHIPGPCCGSHFVRVPTHEKIKVHDGIQGIGDLDKDIYGWDEPVVKLTITRVK